MTEVPAAVGLPQPHAYILNYGGFGYAKFMYSEANLLAFEENFSKIECLDTRKMVLNTIFDNVRSNNTAGSRLLHIIKRHLPAETQQENIMGCLNSIVPQLIGKYLPLEIYEKEKSDMFNMIKDILES